MAAFRWKMNGRQNSSPRSHWVHMQRFGTRLPSEGPSKSETLGTGGGGNKLDLRILFIKLNKDI